MKQQQLFRPLTLTALGFLVLFTAGCGTGGAVGDAAPEAPTASPRLITFRNYNSLNELITLICDDAARDFRGFYAPTAVQVHPFLYVDDTGVKSKTALGMTLADQMAAMTNNNLYNSRMKGGFVQEMRGVLQEVDGHLRVHISGVNGKAQRHSYSVNVEMTEAIYRALHSRIQG